MAQLHVVGGGWDSSCESVKTSLDIIHCMDDEAFHEAEEVAHNALRVMSNGWAELHLWAPVMGLDVILTRWVVTTEGIRKLT